MNATTLDLIRLAYEHGNADAMEADAAAYELLIKAGDVPTPPEPDPYAVRKYGRETARYMARMQERPDLAPMMEAIPSWRSEPVLIRSFAHPESRITGGGALTVWAQLSPSDSSVVTLYAHNLSVATPPRASFPDDALAPIRFAVDQIARAIG